ncbi:unnamed protein product [Ilex paraguariensis]|uniref:Uncharacterized protein n=1 Tax=Ilex paraguariensis TaxID=185542 RepID=A0ABC8TDZ4_9AQUA
MDCGRIVFAIIGFSASFFLYFPSFKRRLQSKQIITTHKLKIINEALEIAEERVVRYEERHDRILSQISSFYLVNQELQDALFGAREAMNEALEFVVGLRRLKMEIISSYPGEVDVSMLDRFLGKHKQDKE